MDPERTKLTAPERIYLGYTSFWYETSEEGLHDIEYVRADLLATVRAEAFEEAVEIAETVVCDSSTTAGLRRTIIGHLKAEAAENRKGEG